jgi:hypothetical protein
MRPSVSGPVIISLSEIDANVRVSGDQAFTWISSSAFTHVDGNGVADFVIRVDNVQMLTSSDFML